jgi:hypothetical protein
LLLIHQLNFKNISEAFGADCSVESNSKEEHYQKTQQLMQNVVKLTHECGIQVAIGFEFGVHPLEYFVFQTEPDKERLANVKNTFLFAPIKELFDTFSSSVRSKGELGELSSINQKLWREYLELQKFLEEKK